jgi:hypothetical protein
MQLEVEPTQGHQLRIELDAVHVRPPAPRHHQKGAGAAGGIKDGLAPADPCQIHHELHQGLGGEELTPLRLEDLREEALIGKPEEVELPGQGNALQARLGRSIGPFEPQLAGKVEALREAATEAGIGPAARQAMGTQPILGSTKLGGEGFSRHPQAPPPITGSAPCTQPE